MVKFDLVHAFLDALERIGTVKDYYCINHAPPEKILKLADFLALWCKEVGIQIEDQIDNFPGDCR